MARGGKRTGTPGKSYGQRVDLNAAPSADVYGEKKATQDRLDAVPIQPAPSPVPAAPPQRPTLVPPGALDRPTERESEPVTSGLASGPGAGPEVLGLADSTLNELRSVYMQYPFEEIRELIEAMDEGR